MEILMEISEARLAGEFWGECRGEFRANFGGFKPRESESYNAKTFGRVRFYHVDRKPPPKVVWFINDQPVQNTSRIGVSAASTPTSSTLRTVRSELRITNLSRKDVHSELTCQAANNNKTGPLAATLHVDMNCK
ncbi:hypothetical protein GWI33_021066 [Rhynchophorus ferrugineus]|uniref:Immunoglobulin I-set domain-containing protein n=1 Tax=Rhynchophorus ferrugineus TaxID=354439 RepID=A0A834M2T5_RHYFE|nr:hypothetical protein GWI33_021066 [Rhynchophorus ferrugineus]